MNVCGIDPGRSGAMVILREDGTAVAQRMFMRKDDETQLDGVQLAAWLLANDVDCAAVEFIGPRGITTKSGKVIRSAGREFRFAIGVGVIHGVLQAMGLPYRTVPPMTWQANVVAGFGTGKEASIAFVQKHLPTVNLTPGQTRKPHDGIADAACIALWGQRYYSRSR